MCNLCSDHLESVAHLFISCKFAKDCWTMLNCHITSNTGQFQTWVSDNMQSLDLKNFGLLLVTCWKIWEARNHRVWNNYTPSCAATVEGARGFLEAWSRVQMSNPILLHHLKIPVRTLHLRPRQSGQPQPRVTILLMRGRPSVISHAQPTAETASTVASVD
nr:putative receptor-like protein kinase [Ipomoea batatas]